MSNKQTSKQKQLVKIQDRLVEHNLPAEVEPPNALPDDEFARQSLVEQRIQQAMADGQFDNLPGQGKPLPLDDNPYQTAGQNLGFHLLKQNGYAPEWIERDKEIRQTLTAARAKVQQAWLQHTEDSPAWEQVLLEFSETLKTLNRKIDSFNLMVPLLFCQRDRLNLTTELEVIRKTDLNEN